MNYLELVNKILIEMNYRTVINFDELVKQDHLKIKQILARVNTEICTSYDWDFLLREKTLSIPVSTSKIVNPIFGRIDSLSLDGVFYRFQPNYKKLLYNETRGHSFSVFDNFILLPKFDEAKTALVTYIPIIQLWMQKDKSNPFLKMKQMFLFCLCHMPKWLLFMELA